MSLAGRHEAEVLRLEGDCSRGALDARGAGATRGPQALLDLMLHLILSLILSLILHLR